MYSSLPFNLLSIIVLLIVAVLVFFVGKNRVENHLAPLAGLAFSFIFAGILFSENRFIGYGLMSVGVIISVVDIFRRAKHK